MDRSLMQLGIAELEALFAKSKTDLKVLRQLEHELKHRKVSRAVALLGEVQQTLSARVRAASTTAVKPTVIVPSSPPLEPQRQLFSAPVATAEHERDPPASQIATLPGRPSARSEPSQLIPPGAPPFDAEEACKILKVERADAWETIERSRRELVDRAHPVRLAATSEEQRARALAEAKRVNLAYAALSAVRVATAVTPAVSTSEVVEP